MTASCFAQRETSERGLWRGILPLRCDEVDVRLFKPIVGHVSLPGENKTQTLSIQRIIALDRIGPFVKDLIQQANQLVVCE